jgi:hypothetical protein
VSLLWVMAGAATVRFGTSSRDAGGPKVLSPGPDYVPEGTVGREAPAFSFGKVGHAALAVGPRVWTCVLLHGRVPVPRLLHFVDASTHGPTAHCCSVMLVEAGGRDWSLYIHRPPRVPFLPPWLLCRRSWEAP